MTGKAGVYVNIDKEDGTKSVVCNSADELQIIIAMESPPWNRANYRDDKQQHTSVSTKEKCWDRIRNALAVGQEQLKSNHIKEFSSKMLESEINFGGTAHRNPRAII